jgi:hypothetical protein
MNDPYHKSNQLLLTGPYRVDRVDRQFSDMVVFRPRARPKSSSLRSSTVAMLHRIAGTIKSRRMSIWLNVWLEHAAPPEHAQCMAPIHSIPSLVCGSGKWGRMYVPTRSLSRPPSSSRKDLPQPPLAGIEVCWRGVGVHAECEVFFRGCWWAGALIMKKTPWYCKHVSTPE